MRTLETLSFDNSYARLPGNFHARLAPTPLEAPYLASFNPAAAALIGLDPAQARRPEFVAFMGGSRLLPGADPVAMLYAGHQFGHYVPQLGDGRAILLGEVDNAAAGRWDLHLKGAGQTPYSRDGDGRAVLRSTIREYLCSEAMHGLGIPTTRALCILGSTEEVYRESIESGAMLVRLAPSHVRFGSFEVFYYRDQFEELRLLADYVLAQHFPNLGDHPERYELFLAEVIERTAHLIARWQLVGFAHGVMNTDNMSVLGITLDYGPFGFMDDYDPGFVCNHSDHHGRYAFHRQPSIGLWNLSCLAQALLPLLDSEPQAAAERAQACLARYDGHFAAHFAAGMRSKLGLREAREEDPELAARLLALMAGSAVDYTRFFRALGDFHQPPFEKNAGLRDRFLDREAFDAWARDYRLRLHAEDSDDVQRRSAMNHVNPKYVLRNYLAQQAIERATARQDFSEVERLLALLSRPFDEQPDMESYAAPPPDWGKRVAVSCSS